MDFIVLQPKPSLGGYPLILGRLCLATANTYINCRWGDMKILHVNSTKNFTFYPSNKPSSNQETTSWVEHSDDKALQSLSSLDQGLFFVIEIENDILCDFITYLEITSAYPLWDIPWNHALKRIFYCEK